MFLIFSLLLMPVDDILKIIGGITPGQGMPLISPASVQTTTDSDAHTGSGDDTPASDAITISPVLQFINGKHEITMTPEETGQEARGDQFEVGTPPTTREPEDGTETETTTPYYEVYEGIIKEVESKPYPATTTSTSTIFGGQDAFSPDSTSGSTTVRPEVGPTDDDDDDDGVGSPHEGSGTSEAIPTATSSSPVTVATDEAEVAEGSKSTEMPGAERSTVSPMSTDTPTAPGDLEKPTRPEDYEGSSSGDDDGSGQEEADKSATSAPAFPIVSQGPVDRPASIGDTSSDPRQAVTSTGSPLAVPDVALATATTAKDGAQEEGPSGDDEEQGSGSDPTIKMDDKVDAITQESPLAVPATTSEEGGSGEHTQVTTGSVVGMTTLLPALGPMPEDADKADTADAAVTKEYEGSAEYSTPLSAATTDSTTRATLVSVEAGEGTVAPVTGVREKEVSAEDTSSVSSPPVTSGPGVKVTSVVSASTETKDSAVSREVDESRPAAVTSKPLTAAPSITTTGGATTLPPYDEVVDYEDISKPPGLVEAGPPSLTWTTVEPETDTGHAVEGQTVDLPGIYSNQSFWTLVC